MYIVFTALISLIVHDHDVVEMMLYTLHGLGVPSSGLAIPMAIEASHVAITVQAAAIMGFSKIGGRS